MSPEIEEAFNKYEPVAYEMIVDGDMDETEVIGLILAITSIMPSEFVKKLHVHLDEDL